MMIKRSVWAMLIGCCYLFITGSGTKEEKTVITGYFEGNEPFWEMEIDDNYVVLHAVNETVRDTFMLSQKQAHSETYAFQGSDIYGIVRRSGIGGCDLDITEEGNPSHEIYFSYRNVTYMGCGKLSIRSRWRPGQNGSPAHVP